MSKKTNPYEKKSTKRRRITRKQRTAILCLIIVVALLASILVVSRVALSQSGNSDPHAGHNHAPGEECDTATTADPHAGHNHNTTSAASKLRCQIYQSGDTYTYAIYNAANKLLAKQEGLTYQPKKLTDAGMDMLYCQTADYGFTAGNSIYFDDKHQRVSDPFHGVIGTDGVRVAYCSADDTTVIVQDLFDKKAYYKEYPLAIGTVFNGHINSDKKSVTVAYIDENDKKGSLTIKLYE